MRTFPISTYLLGVVAVLVLHDACSARTCGAASFLLQKEQRPNIKNNQYFRYAKKHCERLASPSKPRTHLSSALALSSLSSTRSPDDDNHSGDSSDSITTPRLHRLDDVRRIYCLSDLHTDHVVNLEWLRDRMSPSKSNFTSQDLLVVAGDISHDLEILEQSLLYMRERGCQVLFVPGNHEAWMSKHERKVMASSLDKFRAVLQVCKDNGVLVDPCYVTASSPPASSSNIDSDDINRYPQNPIVILPIQSWYDGTLSFSERLCRGFEHWPWMDFLRCRWPDRFQNPLGSRIPSGLVEHLLESNEKNIRLVRDTLLQSRQQQEDKESDIMTAGLSLMTVSHFLPNKQCLPDWADLTAHQFDVENWLDHGAAEMSAKFAKVAGSSLIDDQIRSILPNQDDDRTAGGQKQQQQQRRLRRHLHVFGHSHRPKDFTYKGIRYIHNPLGKPRERELHMVSPDVDFQLLWDCDAARTGDGSNSSDGMVPGERILRYWEEKGGGKEALWERMRLVRPGRYGQLKKKGTKQQKQQNQDGGREQTDATAATAARVSSTQVLDDDD